MSRYERHILVCENERAPDNPKGCCRSKGGPDITGAFKKALAQHGLLGRMRCNSSGCLDACGVGPAVVIYPEAVWYTVPSVEDAMEIVREHLLEGRVVERLRMVEPAPKRA